MTSKKKSTLSEGQWVTCSKARLWMQSYQSSGARWTSREINEYLTWNYHNKSFLLGPDGHIDAVTNKDLVRERKVR